MSSNEESQRLLNSFDRLTYNRAMKIFRDEPDDRRKFFSLRESLSFEFDESSTDAETNRTEQTREQDNEHETSSSLSKLCLVYRRHQLLLENDRSIEQGSNENEFNWWKTIDHLRPILERIIASMPMSNDDQTPDFAAFIRSRRRTRRNGICLALDRLCFNDQLFLFVTLVNQVQIDFSLLLSNFKCWTARAPFSSFFVLLINSSRRKSNERKRKRSTDSLANRREQNKSLFHKKISRRLTSRETKQRTLLIS